MAQSALRSPVDGARRVLATAFGKVKRLRYPSTKKLLAMSPEEVEAFLERTGTAQQVREALAETEPSDH